MIRFLGKTAKWLLIGMGVTVVLLAVITSSGCDVFGGGAKYSDDPTIAMKQMHVERCSQMRQFMNTAYSLRTTLTEDEKQIVDMVDAVYRPVCEGEPLPPTDALTNAGALAAIAVLCPELEASDDAIVTISQAASCAARKALLLQLEG